MSGWLRLIDVILVMGVVVVLPLALSGRVRWWAGAGAGVVLSFLLPVGWESAMFVLPFVVVAFGVAIGPRGGLAATYAVVASIALLQSRLGFDPFGVGEPIGELTAVHFTYAGAGALSLARGMPVVRAITANAAPYTATSLRSSTTSRSAGSKRRRAPLITAQTLHGISLRRDDGAMFVVEDFVAECQHALAEQEPRRAVREVLTRAVADASGVATALEHHHAGITLLHNTDELTVLNVVWGPRMQLPPHDHRMWAAIGIYAGQEDNGFFRRDGDRITDSGGKQLRESDVLLLGDDAIHSVTNPLRSYTGAIHVYGGNFVTKARSQWDPETKLEEPYDYDRILKVFEASNALQEK